MPATAIARFAISTWAISRAGRSRFDLPAGQSSIVPACISAGRTGMLPLPVPESGGTINLLRPYVNLGELDFRLFVAWLTAAMRPAGPYPPLVLYGEQGSAKTTLAKVARLLDRSSLRSASGRADEHSRPDDHGAQ